jgi:signal transduction histidine kinase
MRERATALGGIVEYGTGPRGGFRVEAEIPVEDR